MDKKIELLWNVIPSRKYGHPGPLDKKVFREIEQIIEENGHPVSNPITFTTYELCKRLGKSIGGKQYKVLLKSLKRIAATSINSRGTFYSKSGKRWIEDFFSLYDRILLRGEELPDGTVAEANYLYLSDVYRDSLNAQYIKPIDYTYWKSLKKEVSKRLYELLSVKFYGIINKNLPHLRYRYENLCQLLPIKKRAYKSRAKQKLNPGHKELIQTGFLKKVTWKDWLIYYFPGSRAFEEIKESEKQTGIKPDSFKPVETMGDEEKALVKSLVSTILEATGDQDSKKFYRNVAQMVLTQPRLEELIFQASSEMKYASRTQDVQNKGALFTHILKDKCSKAGIDLGLKTS